MPEPSGRPAYVGSNAIGLEPTFIKFYSSYPSALITGGLFAGAGLLMMVVHWCVGGPLLVLGLIAVFGRYKLARRGLGCGTTNPAIVVSLKPMRLAVFADMTLTSGRVIPAVVIVEAPSSLHDEVDLGDKLPVVCNYYTENPQASDRWTELIAYPVQSVTVHESEVDRAMKAICPAEWVALKQGLDQISDRVTKKVHWVEVDQRTLDKIRDFVPGGSNR